MTTAIMSYSDRYEVRLTPDGDYDVIIHGNGIITTKSTYHDGVIAAQNHLFEIDHGPGVVLHYATPVTTLPQLSEAEAIQTKEHVKVLDCVGQIEDLLKHHRALKRDGRDDEAAKIKQQARDLIDQEFSTAL